MGCSWSRPSQHNPTTPLPHSSAIPLPRAEQGQLSDSGGSRDRPLWRGQGLGIRTPWPPLGWNISRVRGPRLDGHGRTGRRHRPRQGRQALQGGSCAMIFCAPAGASGARGSADGRCLQEASAGRQMCRDSCNKCAVILAVFSRTGKISIFIAEVTFWGPPVAWSSEGGYITRKGAAGGRGGLGGGWGGHIYSLKECWRDRDRAVLGGSGSGGATGPALTTGPPSLSVH